jgi:anti-sigma regulatory factor (Ser/Thr protein kinase)
MSLFFSVQDSTARLTIRDDGTFFSPDQANEPDLEADWDERNIGGLGIFFVKELMDRVDYSRQEPGFNEFIIEKKVNH